MKLDIEAELNRMDATIGYVDSARTYHVAREALARLKRIGELADDLMDWAVVNETREPIVEILRLCGVNHET